MKDCAQSDLHRRLRNEGVLLGDLFTFISGLSFRRFGTRLRYYGVRWPDSAGEAPYA